MPQGVAGGGNSKVAHQAFAMENVLIRVSDGQGFVAPVGLRGLPRPSPAEAEMVDHHVAERGVAKADVFAGDPGD